MVEAKIEEALERLFAIERRIKDMATHDDVKAAIDELKGEIGSAAERVSRKIQTLQDKINAGGDPAAFQADLDEIAEEMDELKNIAKEETV